MLLVKLLELGEVAEGGFPSVAGECVDNRRNISGEGHFLDYN